MIAVIPLWLHIIAATIWVGSQVMMFVAVIPAGRLIDEPQLRMRFLQSLTVRFGWLGAGALTLLVLTGIDNISRYAPGDVFDYRYGYVLTVKLVMVVLIIALTYFHTRVVGPRLMHELMMLAASGTPDFARLSQLRRTSILTSSVILLLSLAVLFCAGLLRTPFSFHGT